MAALNASSAANAGTPNASITSSTLNTLTSSDTFSFQSGDIIHMRNATGGALTPNFLGNANSAIGVPGYGLAPTSSGYTCASIAPAAERLIRADDILAHIQGSTTITGGTGIIMTIFRR